MHRLTRLTGNNPLLVFVPGFLGNVHTELFSNLRGWSEDMGFDYWMEDFKGHSPEELELAPLSQQFTQLRSTYTLIRELCPRQDIVLIGHSQGGYLITRLLDELRAPLSVILLNPAFTLTDIILINRLTAEERSTLQRGEWVFKQFKPQHHKWLSPQWYQEYANLTPPGMLPNIHAHAIWGAEDTIVSVQDKEFLTTLGNVQHSTLTGDHSFSGEDFANVSQALQDTLSELPSAI